MNTKDFSGNKKALSERDICSKFITPLFSKQAGTYKAKSVKNSPLPLAALLCVAACIPVAKSAEPTVCCTISKTRRWQSLKPKTTIIVLAQVCSRPWRIAKRWMCCLCFPAMAMAFYFMTKPV